MGVMVWLLLAAVSCSPVDVCRDVLESFVGEVVIESAAPAVRLAWASDSEFAGVGYRLVRLPCGGCAPESVAAIRAAGVCGAPATYQVIDVQPADRYRLEVLARGVACVVSVDVR